MTCKATAQSLELEHANNSPEPDPDPQLMEEEQEAWQKRQAVAFPTTTFTVKAQTVTAGGG